MKTDNEILIAFDEAFKELDSSRDVRERSWMRNILYFLGEQWLSWFEEQNTFGRSYQLYDNIPTPVSNVIRDYVKAMKALILNKQYSVRVWPNSNEKQDVDAAELAGAILQWSEALGCHENEDVKEDVALWMVMTGNGFCRTYQNSDNGKYVVDKNGKVVKNKGDIESEAISPFNIVIPTLGERLRDKKYVGIKSLKDKDWIEDTFNVSIKKADNTVAMDYQKQLMTLIANVSPWKGRGVESGLDPDINSEDMVVFREIEYKPTQQYPKGRYFAVAGGNVLIKQDSLPIPVSNEGEWYYTIGHFPYNKSPGCFFATSGIDDLISPQNTINQIDQTLVQNRKSIGRPWVLTPKELVLSRKSAAGHPFLQIEYDPTLTHGLKPEVVQGVPFPAQILQERDYARQTVQEAAGDPKNILRGQSPHSGASGVMVDILKEAAELTHTPDVERFFREWTRASKKKLILAQAFFTEKRLLKIPGKGSEILIKQFKGSDLYNNTDIRLTLDNKTSSTQAGKNQFLLSLLQNQFFGDVSEKPALSQYLLERFGVSGVPVENNLHTERAKRENSAIVYGRAEDIQKIALPAIPVTDENGEVINDPQTGESRVIEVSSDPLFMYDNHQIHIDVLDELILSKEFDSLEGRIKLVAVSHRKMHEQVLQQQQAQQQEQMMQMAQQQEVMKKMQPKKQ